MSSADSVIRVLRAEKIRQRQRQQVNAQDLTQSFRVPISGTASSGVAYTRTDIMYFDSPFRPEQASQGGMLRPTFTYGFELNERTATPNNENSLTGFAKVVGWWEDASGYITGVICDIGVALLADAEDLPFQGYAHLQFTGPALMTSDYTIGETT